MNEVGSARIVVVDDHEIIAQSLSASLSALGHDVLRVDCTEPDLVATIRGMEPDLVVLDLDLGPAGSGGRLVAPLTEGACRVLVLTGVTDRVRKARCLRSGAVAVVGKHRSFDELRAAIGTAVAGDELLSPHEREEELAWLRSEDALRRGLRRGFEELTPREEEVLGGLLHGHAVDEIADKAVVAPSTVRSQVRSILRKLGVNSQLAAVARAREAGWDPPEPMGS